MRRRLAILIAVVLSAVVAGTAAPAQHTIAEPAVAVHSCSSRYRHAVMPDGSHKCLGTGQFCRRAWEPTYRRYGFTCKPGSDGRYRLHRRVKA